MRGPHQHVLLRQALLPLEQVYQRRRGHLRHAVLRLVVGAAELEQHRSQLGRRHRAGLRLSRRVQQQGELRRSLQVPALDAPRAQLHVEDDPQPVFQHVVVPRSDVDHVGSVCRLRKLSCHDEQRPFDETEHAQGNLKTQPTDFLVGVAQILKEWWCRWRWP